MLEAREILVPDDAFAVQVLGHARPRQWELQNPG
jgi:hypothetical protein